MRTPVLLEIAITALLAALALVVFGAAADAGNPYAEAAERDAALEAATNDAQKSNPHRGQSDDDSVQGEAEQAQSWDGSRYQRYQDRGYQNNSWGRGCGQGARRNQYGNCIYDQNRGGSDRVWVVTDGVGRWVTYPNGTNPPRNITSPSRTAPPSNIQAPPSRIAAPPSKIAAPPSDIRPPW